MATMSLTSRNGWGTPRDTWQASKTFPTSQTFLAGDLQIHHNGVKVSFHNTGDCGDLSDAIHVLDQVHDQHGQGVGPMAVNRTTRKNFNIYPRAAECGLRIGTVSQTHPRKAAKSVNEPDWAGWGWGFSNWPSMVGELKLNLGGSSDLPK